MIFAVDHIVFAVAASDRAPLADLLVGRGLATIPLELDFPEIGAASESVATADGSFVELVYETKPGKAPAAWFEALPRVIGVGFSSDDFERDVAAWGEQEGMWLMDEDKTLADGSVLNIHAAGPHPHFEDLYVFLMDRTELPYADRGARAGLRALTFSGATAHDWRDRLAGWFGLVHTPAGFRVGDGRGSEIEVRFEANDSAGVQVSPTFGVPFYAEPIALAAGEIRFTRLGEGADVVSR